MHGRVPLRSERKRYTVGVYWYRWGLIYVVVRLRLAEMEFEETVFHHISRRIDFPGLCCDGNLA